MRCLFIYFFNKYSILQENIYIFVFAFHIVLSVIDLFFNNQRFLVAIRADITSNYFIIFFNMRKFTIFKLLLISTLGLMSTSKVFAQATLPVNAAFSTVTTAGAGVMPNGFSMTSLTGYAGALKFATVGASLILNFDRSPGTLTFDLGVNNTFPGTILSTMTFNVDESVDGATWTNLASYTNVAGGTKTITSLNSNSRYIRWIYSIKPNGFNVALKNITLAAGVSCTASNLTFATSSLSKTTADAQFTLLATSLNGTTPIVYSSSAPTVASVDAVTGEVALLTAGSTVITANQVFGTHNTVDYCQTSATYSLTVLPVPTISVTEVIVPTMITTVGSSRSETINISAANLTDENGIALALSGANSNVFALSETTISQTAGVVATTPVTVTYSPVAEGTHTALMTISSSGAADVLRDLVGTAFLASGLNNPTASLTVSLQNGYILFNGVSGEKVELYNALGQKLESKAVVDGLNAVTVNSRGMVVIKVGNRVAKVML